MDATSRTPSPDQGSWLALGILAGFLNFLCLGGLGYFVLGQHKKALAAMAANLVLACLGLNVFLALIATVDAIYLATRRAKGEPLGEWQVFEFGTSPAVVDGAPPAPWLVAMLLLGGLLPMVGIIAAIAIPNFVEMQYRAKRAECPANVDGITTAVMGYRAAHGELPALASEAWPPMHTIGKEPQPWVRTPEWDALGWAPDGAVRGSYQVVALEDGDFEVHGWCDIDGDGDYAHYVATPGQSAWAQSRPDVY